MERPTDEPDFNIDDEIEYEYIYDEYLDHEAELMAEIDEANDTQKTTLASQSPKLHELETVKKSRIESPTSPHIALNREHSQKY